MDTDKHIYTHLDTNITKLEEQYGMQTHTAKEINKLLDIYLPHGYSVMAVERAKDQGRETTRNWVRSVKCLRKSDLQILNILIEIAKNNKAVAEAQKAKFNQLICK